MWPIQPIAGNWRRRQPQASGLDAVVNNAGTLGASPLPPLLDYPLEALLEVFRINAVAQLGDLAGGSRCAEAGRSDREHHQRRRR